MNKFTKIWVLWLGLLALTTALFVNAANNGATQKVSLTLNWSNNTCTTSDFALGSKTASSGATAFSAVSHDLTCEFLENWSVKVNLSLADLSAGSSLSIPKGNFSFSITAWTKSWNIAALTASGNTFAADRTIYTKEANKLWAWTTSLSISWTVPAYTAAWTYTGNLQVTIQAAS